MQSTAEKHTEQTAPAEPDRLAAAEFFARELNESRLWKIRISYQKRWTKHRRTQKSLEIQRTRPHLARMANQNTRARRTGPQDILMKRALKTHGTFLRAVSTLCRLRKTDHPLAPFFAAYCNKLGAEATDDLLTALTFAKLRGELHPAFVSRVTSPDWRLAKP